MLRVLLAEVDRVLGKVGSANEPRKGDRRKESVRREPPFVGEDKAA
jgi:hypothetical protein